MYKNTCTYIYVCIFEKNLKYSNKYAEMTHCALNKN